jgi:hypothetical protein
VSDPDGAYGDGGTGAPQHMATLCHFVPQPARAGGSGGGRGTGGERPQRADEGRGVGVEHRATAIRSSSVFRRPDARLDALMAHESRSRSVGHVGVGSMESKGCWAMGATLATLCHRARGDGVPGGV